MRIVFLSNYFSHHQKPLSDALAAQADYTFLATAEMTAERRTMGWGDTQEPAYVCQYDAEPDRARQCLESADVVIAGSAPEALIRQCIRKGKLVFRYSERPLKNGLEPLKYLPRLIRWHRRNPGGKPIYLLCASAYTAGDYARFGLFRGRAYRWGYFPETIKYETLPRKKPASILWVGRFLDLKHPEDAIRVAAKLKEADIPFEMTLIGTGPMQARLQQMIAAGHLQAQVHLPDAMKPEEVRRHMEQAQIFLFTSDRKEGWGAVLNEAMNSGCAVVASDAAGSVAYLVRDGENGCVYPSGDVDALFAATKELLLSPEKAARMGAEAYSTVTGCWNGEAAAARLLELAESLLQGKPGPVWENGPCSLDGSQR